MEGVVDLTKNGEKGKKRKKSTADSANKQKKPRKSTEEMMLAKAQKEQEKLAKMRQKELEKQEKERQKELEKQEKERQKELEKQEKERQKELEKQNKERLKLERLAQKKLEKEERELVKHMMKLEKEQEKERRRLEKEKEKEEKQAEKERLKQVKKAEQEKKKDNKNTRRLLTKYYSELGKFLEESAKVGISLNKNMEWTISGDGISLQVDQGKAKAPEKKTFSKSDDALMFFMEGDNKPLSPHDEGFSPAQRLELLKAFYEEPQANRQTLGKLSTRKIFEGKKTKDLEAWFESERSTRILDFSPALRREKESRQKNMSSVTLKAFAIDTLAKVKEEGMTVADMKKNLDKSPNFSHLSLPGIMEDLERVLDAHRQTFVQLSEQTKTYCLRKFLTLNDFEKLDNSSSSSSTQEKQKTKKQQIEKGQPVIVLDDDEDEENEDEDDDDGGQSVEQDLVKLALKEEKFEEDECEDKCFPTEIDDDGSIPIHLPVLHESCLPFEYSYIENNRPRNLPNGWPSPKSSGYQEFLQKWMNGDVDPPHNWGPFLAAYKARRNPVATTVPKLTAWQALGYKHAQKVLHSPDIRGCLYWWTPGSGKSVMVALLLELLFFTDMQVYVVSTPQNTRQNGLEECAKSMLRFSPVFAETSNSAGSGDVQNMLRQFRRRSPPIYKKNFMSFKQFTTFYKQDPTALENAAIIIDESHELFNDRICDRQVMFGQVLEGLTKRKKGKVFTLSGTPGQNISELLLQIELVRHAKERIDHSEFDPSSNPQWKSKLKSYVAGLISYVDGTKDYSNYPKNNGVEVVRTPVSLPLLAYFSPMTEKLPLKDSRFDNLFEHLRSNDVVAKKFSLNMASTLQRRGNVYRGGNKNGLFSTLDTLCNDDLAKYAPKLCTIIEHINEPKRKTDRLETKHFIYSRYRASITSISKVFGHLKVGGNFFAKELKADDLAWSNDNREAVQVSNKNWQLDHKDQIVFVDIKGTVDDKRKLLAAFGYCTPDNFRYDGLTRAGSSVPLVQVIIGTHETNQGITLLRLQNIHLFEPDARGWSQVIQTTGRGVRRGTHFGLENHPNDAMRQVTTYVHQSVPNPDFEELRLKQYAQLSLIQNDFVEQFKEYRDEQGVVGAAAETEDECMMKIFGAREHDLRKDLAALAKQQKNISAELEKLEFEKYVKHETDKFLKRQQRFKTKLVKLWDELPDETIFKVTEGIEKEKKEFEAVLKGMAIDCTALFDFHDRHAGQVKPMDTDPRSVAVDVDAQPPSLFECFTRLYGNYDDDGHDESTMLERMRKFVQDNYGNQEKREAVLRTFQEADCIICYDTVDQGLLCKTCNMAMCIGCSASFIKTRSEEMDKLKKYEGRLECPAPDCISNEKFYDPEPSDVRKMKLILPKVIHGQYLRLKTLYAELVSTPESTPIGTDVRTHKKHIEEEILNLRCPKKTCRVPWDTFNGCCALQCGSCGGHFCAFCQTLCRDDQTCHQHVARCEWNPKKDEFFTDHKTFERVSAMVKADKLRKYIDANVSSQDKVLLRQGLDPILKLSNIKL